MPTLHSDFFTNKIKEFLNIYDINIVIKKEGNEIILRKIKNNYWYLDKNKYYDADTQEEKTKIYYTVDGVTKLASLKFESKEEILKLFANINYNIKKYSNKKSVEKTDFFLYTFNSRRVTKWIKKELQL